MLYAILKSSAKPAAEPKLASGPRNPSFGLLASRPASKVPAPLKDLEHVELKCAAVQREKHAPNNGLDRLHGSMNHEHDLEQ